MSELNSSQSDEELNKSYNFLEDIKGHLEILSFETKIHDIYNPEHSRNISPRISQTRNRCFSLNYKKKILQTDRKSATIHSLNSFCAQLEGSITKRIIKNEKPEIIKDRLDHLIDQINKLYK